MQGTICRLLSSRVHLTGAVGAHAAGSLITEAGAVRLRSVPLLNIRACEAVATEVQLLHSPVRFDHLRASAAQAC